MAEEGTHVDIDEIGSTHFIRNVPISFPFSPYDCQLLYMEKVIQALQEKSNAILESPTGTGKTLCLLCSTLAWRKELIRLKQSYVSQVEKTEGSEFWDPMSECYQGDIPKIIYSSRTHSQLSQAIKELKNTKYRPHVSIIGSREQMCINSEVMNKESNSEKVHLCRAKVQSKTCGYYNNLDMRKLPVRPNDIMDVEDLVLIGNRHRMCPYYIARELKSDADLIFMPYNYILDIKTRKMHGIDIQGAIIILDEAHNIERVCEDSASFDLTSVDLAHCVSDVDYVLKAKMKEMEELSEDSEKSIQQELEDLVNLKKIFLTLEEKLDAIELHEDYGDSTKPGSFMYEFLKSVEITNDTFPTLMEQCGSSISFLTTGGQKVFKSGGYIQKFVDAMKVVFSSFQSSTHHYKVYIKRDDTIKRRPEADPWAFAAGKKEVRTLSYWCFNPGHTMRELAEQGVRSIILTSGTLSPIDSFTSELQLEFPIKLQGSHVISSDQVWVGVLKRGCDTGRLNSSYQFRFTSTYQNSLGNTLVNFARFIPHGMLVFFPSYPQMYSCYESWKTTGILSRIEQFKQVFREPKKKTEFYPTMDRFYEKVRDPSMKGAIFFAVCRGKVSEGLDFADANGRAVVITGMPFPPKDNPKVKLKMEYLIEARKNPNSKVMHRDDWYRQQATRAVNQAIGRIIRHKDDYGAIILCDERFSFAINVNQIAPWVKPYLKSYDRFGSLQRELIQFFKRSATKYGTKVSSKSDDRNPKCTTSSMTVQKTSLTNRIEIFDKEIDKDVRIPAASLARLEAQTIDVKSQNSLLDSLRDSECKTIQPHHLQVQSPSTHIISAASSHLQLGSLTQSGSRVSIPPISSDVVKKKVVIVNKSSDGVKTLKAHEFITKLKENLSDNSFMCFKSSITEYKKSGDIHEFLKQMQTIFNHPSTFQLLQGMSKFVREQHIIDFNQFFTRHTGKTISTEPVSGIKRRIDELGPVLSANKKPYIEL